MVRYFCVADRLIEEVVEEPYVLHSIASELGHYDGKFKVATDNNLRF